MHLGNRTILERIFLFIFVIIFIIWTFFPIYWMISTSIKPTLNIFDLPPKFYPKNPTYEHYVNLQKGSARITIFFMNSVITSTSTVVLSLAVAFPAAYALSRLRFRFRKIISIGVLSIEMFPLVVMLIPLYLLYKKLHLLNTYQGIILAFTSFTLPFSIWMLRGFIDSVPKEIEESAHIDGCSRLQIITRIVFPLTVPGIAATCIYTFLDSWNNLLFPMMLTNKPSMKTLPPGMVLAYVGQYKHDWGGMMAASVIVSIPVVLAFVLVQRYFIEGLTRGALKG
jgi:multiple sugar transport system permease protein